MFMLYVVFLLFRLRFFPESSLDFRCLEIDQFFLGAKSRSQSLRAGKWAAGLPLAGDQRQGLCPPWQRAAIGLGLGSPARFQGRFRAGWWVSERGLGWGRRQGCRLANWGEGREVAAAAAAEEVEQVASGASPEPGG